MENPYLKRWFVIPRNKFFNIYLHRFLRSDDDRALHDHPWINMSILLDASYTEVTPKGSFLREAGHVYFRGPKALHRVLLHPDQIGIEQPVWTLFITGPKVREWGFACPKGWVHWEDFVHVTEGGNEVGQGCGS